MDYMRSPPALEKLTQAYLKRNEYNAQRVSGFAGTHALTASKANMPGVMHSRPMVQLFNEDGDFVTQVPLPIARHLRTGGRHKTPPQTVSDYNSVETNPTYEKVPWAHEALKKLAQEYDHLEAAGLGELYVQFHGSNHVLAIVENGADLHTLVRNKITGNLDTYHLYNRNMGSRTVNGSMSALEIPDTQHALTIHSKNYPKSPRNTFSHELSHHIDRIEKTGEACYSENVLFESALMHDISSLKSSPQKVNQYILHPVLAIAEFGGIRTKQEERTLIAREFFATIFEAWIANPAQMKQDFPCVHDYIEHYVLPDLRLRQKSGEDRSYLSEVLAAPTGQDWLKEFNLSLSKQHDFLDAITDLKHKVARDQNYQLKIPYQQHAKFMEVAEELVAEHTPKACRFPVEAHKGLADMVPDLHQQMLERSGLPEIPRTYEAGTRYTGR